MRTKIRCVVIDDNEDAAEELCEYISKVPYLELDHCFTEPLEAFYYIKEVKENIDIVFMDVDMPMITGIELSTLLRKKINHLIFTTSHSKYALDAFEVEAYAFLLKPFGFAKFLEKIEKIPRNSADRNNTTEEDYLFVRSKEDNLKLVKVYFKEIVAVESLLNYVSIYTLTSKVITYTSLKEIRTLLSGRTEFVQLHRSFVISTLYIKFIDAANLYMSNGLKIPIGDSYRPQLEAFLSGMIFKPGNKK